jgi:hypothetical protein
MPRGYNVRRPEPMQVSVTMVEIQGGSDLLESLKDACLDYMPAIMFSALGETSPALLRVPRDECIDELVNSPMPFGVKIEPNFDVHGQPGMTFGGPLPSGMEVPADTQASWSLKPQPFYTDMGGGQLRRRSTTTT